jgi:hypothetical protein
LITEQHKSVLNSVLRLLDKWRLAETEKRMLLGFEPANVPKTLSTEQELRFSLLLNIHAELRQLFTNPANLYGYMTMANHNPPFNGKRPLDLACKSLDGLHSVYDAIRQISTF